jgi:hypothetical protein
LDYCAEREALKANVSAALHDIIGFSDRLLSALETDESIPLALDKDLETFVGVKERALGALAQHRKDHGC